MTYAGVKGQMVSGGALATTGDRQDDSFERVESVQVLEPGYYWTSTVEREDLFDLGETLLLLEVTEFEGRAHSVSLRVHPLRGKGSITLLVDDFLSCFVPCQEAEAIRAKEQREVLAEVAELQDELVRTQSSPQLMYEAVKEDIEKALAKEKDEEQRKENRASEKNEEKARDLSKVHRRAARRSESRGNPLVAPAAAIASEIGGVLNAGINQAGVEEMKKFASQQAVVATVQAKWLRTKTEQITQALGKLVPFMEERSAVALARSSGAVKLANRIREGVESLDLYTGKGIDVFDVRTGKAAPPSEPLSLIQGKRFMDEELAAWADVTQAFDFRSKKSFFEELARNDELLGQVLPTERCVVSMAVTREPKQYENALENVVYNLQNQLVFLLVRNGENVHVVYSGSPSHEAAQRLFPTLNELEEPFRGMDGSKISIRDVGFGEATKDFNTIALLYRRFLILLCGLDHRLQLMGEFYPADQAMQFMTVWFQEKYFRFVCDEEASGLLGENLMPLGTWMAERNQMLQSGSRVFLLRNSEGLTKNTAELKRRDSLEATKEQFSKPFVASREGLDHFVMLDCEARYGDAAPTNAKCYLAPGSESHTSVWWLCVDAVTVEEVRRYRHSRIHRGMGVGYLMLFRRIEAYLESELQEQAAAREYLLKTAVEHGGLSQAEASACLETGIRNWRASRRGAPLPTMGQMEQLNEVLTLMVPEGKISAELEAMVLNFIETSEVDPVLMTRSGRSRMYLYVAPTAEDKAAFADVLTWGWVRRITLKVGKTKVSEGNSSLVWLTKVLPASEVKVRRWDAAQAWLNEKEEPIQIRKYGRIPEILERASMWETTLRGGVGGGMPEDLFQKILGRAADFHRERSRGTISAATVCIPVGVFSDDGRTLQTVYMKADANRVLYWYGTPEQRERAQASYAKNFYTKSRAKSHLAQPLKWKLISTSNESLLECDEIIEDGPRPWNTPSWATHSCQTNAPRDRFWHKKKIEGGGPSLRDARSELSLNRAFDQLSGFSPMFLRRSFLKSTKEEARRLRTWGLHGPAGRRTEEDERNLEEAIKAKLGRQYVHALRSVVSKMITSPKTGRSVANSLFVAPLVKKGVAMEAETAAQENGA